MKKRALILLTTLVMLLGCACAETAPVEKEHHIEVNEVPVYEDSRDAVMDTKYQVCLIDGVQDLPYTDLESWTSFMNDFMTDGGETPGYELKMTANEDERQVTLTRENSYTAWFDFNTGTIIFDDYVAFTNNPDAEYLDVADIQMPELLKMTAGRHVYGNITTVNLKEYGIPMIFQDGKFLLPLQTLSALFLYPIQYASYYNGEAMFLTAASAMTDPLESMRRKFARSGAMTPEIREKYKAYDGPQEGKAEYLFDLISQTPEEKASLMQQYEIMRESSLFTLYAGVPAAERSEELMAFGTAELCLELDCFYGLKEAHGIVDGFRLFFMQTGLDEGLSSPDASIADQAVSDLVDYWLDDGHSGFTSRSWMAASAPDRGDGFGYLQLARQKQTLTETRANYPDAGKHYYEVGDTAYITFDNFTLQPGEDGVGGYYRQAQEGGLPEDTFGIIIDAHRRITRENSPIQNVVLDLSCNTGGSIPAAVYTLCWFLGESRVSVYNTFTGAQSTMFYKADINMDHVQDEQDTLAGRGLNLFCLISPVSFSCGNLVPWAFKESGNVTLLGRTSGGGSCVVFPITTAWGTTLQISGARRIAFVKNGSYYDVDRGVEPDYVIHTYEHYYNRDALTEYIHTLY